MRLYYPRIRLGTRAQTLFKPRRVNEEEIETVRAMFDPGLPPWITVPDGFFKLPKEVQAQIIEWLLWFSFLAWRTFGKAMGAAVHQVVNEMFMLWVKDALIAESVGKIVGYTLPLVVLLAALYIINPVVKKTIYEDWEDFRYLGRYEEKMWFFDHVGTRRDGRTLYLRCSETPGQIVFERRLDWTYRGRLDHWWLEHTWVEERREELFWRVWVWGDIWVDYVGMLEHVAENVYILQPPAVDSWAAEMPPGWVKDPTRWCVAPGY